MAASDSTPLPIKNQALQITFGMWLTTGLINSGATSPDSEVSKDGGAYADCTNEITEIGSSGTYTLDLTNTEMNADVVAIQVKSATANAITYKITIYPSSGSKFQTNSTQWGGSNVTGMPMPTYTQPGGFLAATFPGTVASTTNITAGTITTTTNLTNLPAITANWLTATGIAADAITAAKIADGAIDTATFASGATIPRCTLVDTTTTNTDMRGTNNAALAATALSTAVWTAPPTGFLAATFPGTVSSYAGGAVASVTGAVGSVTGLSTSTISAAVWDLATSGHTTSGSFGAAMISASSAGDPWNTAIPGSYGAGTAGKIVGDNLNATISSVKTKTDFLPGITPGLTGGLLIVGSNASTTFTSIITGTLSIGGVGMVSQTGNCYPGTVKIQAATYDTITLSGSVATLSNAATQTYSSGGRVTA